MVDIGANGGQSAIAFAFILPRHEIVSFEPNPALWPELDFVANVLGARFSYRRVGLGPEAGSMTLFVPHLGNLPITTRASLSREDALAHCETLEKEVNRKAAVRETTVDVVTFDSLGLRPDAIKIDVEGYELHVLEGMRQTLAACRPMLMIESNAKDDECRELLADLGYRLAYFDRRTRKLVDTPIAGAGNWFAIPDGGAGTL